MPEQKCCLQEEKLRANVASRRASEFCLPPKHWLKSGLTPPSFNLPTQTSIPKLFRPFILRICFPSPKWGVFSPSPPDLTFIPSIKTQLYKSGILRYGRGVERAVKKAASYFHGQKRLVFLFQPEFEYFPIVDVFLILYPFISLTLSRHRPWSRLVRRLCHFYKRGREGPRLFFKHTGHYF